MEEKDWRERKGKEEKVGFRYFVFLLNDFWFV